MYKDTAAAGFVRTFQSVQGGVGNDKCFCKSVPAAMAVKDCLYDKGCGIASFIKLSQPGSPGLNVKITYLAELFGRIAVGPQEPGVKGGYMGSKPALWPPKESRRNYPFLGAKENRFPVGFPRRPYTKHQRRGRERSMHNG
jgi:hypothetical protein